VRVRIPRGELSPAQGYALSVLAERHGGGQLTLTNRQNAELRDVPANAVAPLLAALHGAGFDTEGHERLPDVVACVGTTQCRLAISDTAKTCRLLLDTLAADKALREAVGPLRIHVTGCPNNCAQAWIADIGLRGRRLPDGAGGSREGFTLLVGGSLAGAGRIAEPLRDVTLDAVVPAVRGLLDVYLAARDGAAESFNQCVWRLGLDAIRARLAERQPSLEP